MSVSTWQSPTRSAALGAVLLAPALMFLFSVFLEQVFGLGPLVAQTSILASPLLLVGGIALAGVLNTLTTCKTEVRSETRRLAVTLTVEWRPLNLSLIAVGGMMLALFMGYAFVENYAVVAR